MPEKSRGTGPKKTEGEKHHTPKRKNPLDWMNSGMPKMPKRNDWFGNSLSTLLVVVILISLYSLLFGTGTKTETISLSELAGDINSGSVESIVIQGNDLKITYADVTEKKAKKESDAAFSQTLANYGVTPEALTGVSIKVEEGGFRYWFFNLAPILLPLLVIVAIFWFLSRQVRGAGMQAFTFGQSKARMIDPGNQNQRVMFSDIAGAKEAKEELTEIVDFLKNPKKFLDIGARIPKGVILMGAPGTGKTLLARAVAGEAGVPFFSISGSEFVEMFVGVGASVTGDTPVLVKTADGVALKPIAEVVDPLYETGEGGRVKQVHNLQTLGFKEKETGFRGVGEKKFFGGSAWVSVTGAYRHRADKILRICYRGGELRTTGDHSVFVREWNMVRAKRADELKKGDVLVNLPFKVRGAFVPGVGTTHDIRAHAFEESEPLVLDVFGVTAERLMKAAVFARETAGAVSSYAVADRLGVSQTTVLNWRVGKHMPRLFASSTASRTPSSVVVTEELMRLLGYFAAEGDATKYGVRLTFGLHETDLHNDAVSLFKFIFNMDARREPHPETNSLCVIVSSKPIADFFKLHVHTGSKFKRMPAFLWSMSKRYFLAYLTGYARGDGYTTTDGKLSITSVSYEHIRELAWLSAMHGIPSSIRKNVLPAGRVIGNGKPLPETVSWNLIIGKTSHPFVPYVGTDRQLKKPVIESISEEPHNGYVYDLVGCDNEAFFGGEKPLLLHNSRVRDLFHMAKHAAPAIIFVDEIDAVGRVRGTGVGGGNDEREQTLNQILVEMDGFEPNEKVIVMAATNRPDVLDPALLRPGRFDRRVTIDLPDRKDREEILKIHAKKKPLAEDVNLVVIAERTPGFSGADLYSLMNEAAILAARESRKQVAQFDLVRSIEKVMLGPERKSHVLNKKEKEITAYHEAGHALVASILPYADPVHKISIISRGRAAGYTLKLPLEDTRMQSRKEFFDDIAVSLGGYIAEKEVFGDLTTGPSNDLQVLSGLARDMVTKYGMSDELGPLALEGEGGRTLFGRGISDKEYSEVISAKIDAEVKKIIDDAYVKAKDIITKHRPLLNAIAEKLIEVETLERDAFETILIAHGITPKAKQDIEHQK